MSNDIPEADGSADPANAAPGKPPIRILLCSPRGFCAGVVRAIETVEQALARYGAPVYVDGPPPGGCYWQRQRVWDDYYGVWRVRPVRVCY